MDRNPCLYCGTSGASDEHVISGALGCSETIKEGVCPNCNSTFGHTFEAKFITGLALFLNFFKIPNGQGVIPSVRLEGRIGNDKFRFVMTGDGRADVHPRPIGNRRTSTGQEKEFKIFHKRHEAKIENALRSRHNNLVWRRIEHTEVEETIDVEAEFNAQLLCGPEANRTVAKFALNLLVYEYGYEWVKGAFKNLIHFIKGEPSTTRAGIFWEPDLLKRFPFEPPKHLFVIVCDSRTHTATIFLYLFCLFPYCVITEDSRVTIDSTKSGALDPYRGTFTPLFLGGSPQMLNRRSLQPFPMPEYELADILRRIEIGTEKRAARAAKNAVLFMQALYAEQPGMPHICYNCKKILGMLTATCQYCGDSPLPEN